MTLSFNRAWIYKGNLVLVNKKYPIRKEAQCRRFELLEVQAMKRNICLEGSVAKKLNHALKELNYEAYLYTVSGYRTKEDQKRIYKEIYKEKGSKYAKKYVAVPNESEHQTGLAFDIGENVERIRKIYPYLRYRDMTNRFKEQSSLYGFVERYPKGKEKITGIGHEPWHFRYVGVPHSSIMKQKDLTLEEYILYLKKFPLEGKHLEYDIKNIRYEIFYIKAEEERVLIPMEEESEFQVSGNNVDGFVVTIRKTVQLRERRDEEICSIV